MQISITLTDDEASALALITPDPEGWAGNLVRERARQALEAAASNEAAYLLQNGEPLPPLRAGLLASALRSGRAAPVTAPGSLPPLPVSGQR